MSHTPFPEYNRIVVPESFPEGLSKSICHILAKSIDETFVITDDICKNDLLIIGGAGGRLSGWVDYAEKNSICFLCVEKGYLNWKKPTRYRITPNNNQTTMIKKGFDDLRFKELGRSIKPWKYGEDILIVCPSEKVISDYCADLSVDEWVDKTVSMISKISDRKIIVRQKPSKKERNRSSFVKSLENCHCIVTIHSMAAAESLCEGVPVFCLSEGAFSNFSSSDLTKIETPFYPDNRGDLLNCLSYLQFTQPEIASGKAWLRVKEYFYNY